MPWAILSGEEVPAFPRKPSGIKFLIASIGCPRRPLPKTSKVALNLEELGPKEEQLLHSEPPWIH
jgi:hypothetical protein